MHEVATIEGQLPDLLAEHHASDSAGLRLNLDCVGFNGNRLCLRADFHLHRDIGDIGDVQFDISDRGLFETGLVHGDCVASGLEFRERKTPLAVRHARTRRSVCLIDQLDRCRRHDGSACVGDGSGDGASSFLRLSDGQNKENQG